MNANMLIQTIVNGILIGGIYALVALGLTLIFGVMKVINFAQGALLMVGMYITFGFSQWFGLNPYLTIPFSFFLVFLLGGAIQRTVMEKVNDAPAHNQLLVTLGVMMVIENLALVFLSPDFKRVKVESLEQSWRLGDILLDKPRFIAFLFVIVFVSALYWLLHHTRIGKAIRATAIDKDGAMLVGIKVKRIHLIVFGIGTALAGVAGTLLTPFFFISPHVGNIFLLKAFVVVVLGGLGNFVGTFIAGLIIGIAESIGGVYLSGNLRDLVTYVIFVLVLLFRPNGLFGGKNR
jgi:branched-chain amino acid transport system permease protein